MVSVTGRNQMVNGGWNICQRRPCGAPDVCPKQGFPNNGAGHVPNGRERINRQRFSLLQPERQAGWGFSGRANQTEPAGRGKKPRGFSERTGAKSDSTAGRRCAAWSPPLGEIKWSTAAGTYASVDHAARRTYVRSGGSRTTEPGAFRLVGNESPASGFPFSSRSNKRGGVSDVYKRQVFIGMVDG